MSEPIAGKFLLEILTRGMYSNPMHIYREYIQNASDSIDKAISIGLLTETEAVINININAEKKCVVIRDNGIGVSKENAESRLLSVGASDKDGVTERGFRGIGRLGGLAYADQVCFITSAYGENVKTMMICDCVKMQRLLQKANNETEDIIETFKAISKFEYLPESVDEHYFEVKLFNVSVESELLMEDNVVKYLSETAPVDFNSQQFSQAIKIRNYFEEKGFHITCYKILRGSRKLPIYKPYSRNLSTGMQERTKNKDLVRDVEFIYEKASDGKPLYIGWLAITDFSGSISDDAVRGIRFRKGNILVGGETTFSKFFPSEGYAANRMFAGEIHVLHDELVPNSQRDDFEPCPIYNEMKKALTEWAGGLNKNYRRGMSDATSALRKLKTLDQEQKDLEEKLNSGAISSDEKREQMSQQLEKITRSRENATKAVQKALKNGIFDTERKDSVERALEQAEKATKKTTTLTTKIVNSDYATKNDLPSSYSRDERKLYQRIISVIDSYFSNDPKTAEMLREKIKTELSVKKK